jgi:hypothetical protein
MAECLLNEQEKKKLETVQLSNSTVHNRIQDLSAGIKD